MSEYRTYGSIRKVREDTGRCIVAIFKNWGDHQCTRKRGKGPDGLYCTQHANRIQKRADDEARHKKEYEAQRNEWELQRKHGRLLKGDAVFLHALKSMALDLYNFEFPSATRQGYAPPPPAKEWINDLIEMELGDARLVRVKPQ